MVKLLYKRIINKLKLSDEQLDTLYNKLTPENICKGAFVQGNQMCPNTQALQVKLNRPLENKETKNLLKGYGINNLELWTFYLLYDLPAMLSKAMFQRSLIAFKNAVKELRNNPL